MQADVVRVWLIRTDLPDQVIADLGRLLDSEERSRAGSFARADIARGFVITHGAVRMIIGRELGVPPASIRWRRGAHGKPELVTAGPSPAVSVSRSGGLAALAMSDRRGVGVDVQRLEPGVDVVRMAERFYPAAEAGYVMSSRGAGQLSRFTRLWTRKEACLKVCGGLLLSGLRLSVLMPGAIVVSDPGGPLPGPYLVRDLRAPAGFLAAVAAAGAEPYRLLTRSWPGKPSSRREAGTYARVKAAAGGSSR